MTRIPVVEDDRDIRALLIDTLSDIGYEVIGAEDGDTGLRRALNELPDIILLDVMMPAMDGFQLLEKLKEDLNTRSIPVIMVSARSQEQDILGAMKAGAWGYIIKPWEPDELESKVMDAAQICEAS
jgi:two-component system phosphate regulon response regulator PhoB